MDHPDVSVRCQRCGSQMDLSDPGPDDPWPPQQYWECPQCNRHFWTTYPPLKAAKPAAKPTPKPAATVAEKPAAAAPAAAE
jgi:transposase-like protein